jgi:hypothetical protein
MKKIEINFLQPDSTSSTVIYTLDLLAFAVVLTLLASHASGDAFF